MTSFLIFLKFQPSWLLSSLKLSPLTAAMEPNFLCPLPFSLTTFHFVHELLFLPISQGCPLSVFIILVISFELRYSYSFNHDSSKLFSLNFKISSTNHLLSYSLEIQLLK